MNPKLEAKVKIASMLTAKAAGNCWPALPEAELPSPEGRSGFCYGGIKIETHPRRLTLDNRLTPIERNAWQAFKALLNKDGFAVPRYQELQPYLAMSPGKKASRETVARAITILRLTRWITLVTRGRDTVTGRIQGCMYMLHDEPLSVAEVLEMDASYPDLVTASINHPNKSVRVVAEGANRDIDGSEGTLPSRLDVIAERLSESLRPSASMEQFHLGKQESERGDKTLVRIDATPGSESELGQKSTILAVETPSSASELGQKSPSSESEPSEKPTKNVTVRNPNQAQYSTVLSTNTSTVRTVLYGSQSIELRWPNALRFSESEEREILNALTGLSPDVQQMVIDEAASRIAGGGIRSPSGYTLSIISKAKRGDFKIWAANKGQINSFVHPVDKKNNEVFISTGATPRENNDIGKNVPLEHFPQKHNNGQGSPPYLNGARPPIPPVVATATGEPRGPKVISEVMRLHLDRIRAITRR
ncbi:MAG: STY4528 family pathogenicity island replication protein [Betaproteobacteria bacterium]|nr:STY4528 family pathogenicity island replication protein [Betaproteobacteria bacterium]